MSPPPSLELSTAVSRRRHREPRTPRETTQQMTSGRALWRCFPQVHLWSMSTWGQSGLDLGRLGRSSAPRPIGYTFAIRQPRPPAAGVGRGAVGGRGTMASALFATSSGVVGSSSTASSNRAPRRAPRDMYM